MKLPFTWSLSSVWQTATNTIRTTLNLAEKPKKVFVVFAETSKTFHMIIVKCVANCYKHHQNDFELDWKIEKTNVFLLKRQKLGSNQSTFVTFSDKKLTNFQSSLQRVWNYLSHDDCEVDGKTTQTPSERYWIWLKNRKQNNVFLLKRQKLGSNQSNIVTFSDKKLTNFQSSLQRIWNYLSHDHCQVDGKTTQTPSERFWTWPKNEKKQWFFVKTTKLGSNQSNIATFSDKKLTNFQSSLQTVWNYLSHENCQVDGKTTQTPSERFWTWPKNEKKIMFFC